MTTKRFIKFQFIFIILLALTFVCNTFAWVPRPKVTGGGFMSINNTDGATAISKDKTFFTAMQLITPANGYYVNGTGCTATTYTGTYDPETGSVTYGDSEESPSSPITSFSAEAGPGSVFYFKTVITNTTSVTTNVSLYINGKYDQGFGTSFMLGVSSPVIRDNSLTLDTNYDAEGYIHFKLTPVVRSYEINGDGTANVEWYLYNDDDKVTEHFEISSIILTNN